MRILKIKSVIIKKLQGIKNELHKKANQIPTRAEE